MRNERRASWRADGQSRGREERGCVAVTQPLSAPESKSPAGTGWPEISEQAQELQPGWASVSLETDLQETDLQEPAVEYSSARFLTLLSPSPVPQEAFLFGVSSQRSNNWRRMKLGRFFPTLCLPGCCLAATTFLYRRTQFPSGVLLRRHYSHSVLLTAPLDPF